MKNIEDLKKKIEESDQRLNLIYQWVKDGSITFNAFKILLEHIEYVKKRSEMWDD